MTQAIDALPFTRISVQKLNTLKVAHNFYLRKVDGTTVAERFFGQPPESLFSHLLNNVELPGSSRKETAVCEAKNLTFYS